MAMSTALSTIMIFLLVVMICVLFWQGSSVVEELLRLKVRRLFREDLTMSIINRGNNLTLHHIQQIAETRNIPQQDIQRTLKVLLREVLAERNFSLQQHQSLIEDFIAQMKEREPFEGLPNEVRIHLERLRDEMHTTPERLEPLTIQIRELVAVNRRERRIQKYYTVGGFVIGVVGLAFATYAYFYPPRFAFLALQKLWFAG